VTSSAAVFEAAI